MHFKCQFLGGRGARIFGSKYQILKKISKSKKNFFLSEKKKNFFFKKFHFCMEFLVLGKTKLSDPYKYPCQAFKKRLWIFWNFWDFLDFCNFALFFQRQNSHRGGSVKKKSTITKQSPCSKKKKKKKKKIKKKKIFFKKKFKKKI